MTAHAQPNPSPPFPDTSGRRWFWRWSIPLLLLATLPFLAAMWLAPGGTVFTGLLLNPQDGFSYLAKMRQGEQGAWTVQLPYALQEHRSSLIYLQYVLLGKVSAITALPLVWVYHGARIVSGLFVLMALYGFAGRVFPDETRRRTMFLFAAWGCGLTWLSSLFGVLGSDITIPESNIFASVYSNPHFPLATALLLFVAGAAIEPGRPADRQLLIASAANVAAALMQPFLLVIEVAAIGLWAALLVMRQIESIRELLPALGPTLSLVAPATLMGLFILYQLYADPVLAEWTSQNATPSPPPLTYIVGYGALLPLAVLGAVALWRRPDALGLSPRTAMFVLAWAVAGCVLLYAPLSLQRRLSEGLVVPLAALATIGLYTYVTGERALQWVRTGVVAAGAAGALWLAGTSVLGARSLGAPHYITTDDAAALAWLGTHTNRNDLVLAPAPIGNMVPAYSSAKTFWGHPFETPDPANRQELLNLFFAFHTSEAVRCRILTHQGVTYVYNTSYELEFRPEFVERARLEQVYSGIAIIYKVISC